MKKFSRSNKIPYLIFRIKKYVSKHLFNMTNWVLNKTGRELKMVWGNNKRQIPCSKIPHLKNWSNRFEDYTYRIWVKKIEKHTL